MLENGEYGEGLDMKFSAQAYNFSIGQLFFPLTDSEIIKLGGYVAKEPETNSGEIKIISTQELPQIIDKVSDDIINYGIECEITGRPFRVTSSELRFYRKMKLPLPSKHPVVRMQERLLFVPLGIKYLTNCAKCQKRTDSLFNPKDDYILYCEKCYQQEVY